MQARQEDYRYVSEGRYTADRDLVDSLKLEVSTQAPSQDSALKRTAATIVKTLERSYGSYIPASKLEELDGIPDRILMTDGESLRAVGTYWHEERKGRQNTEYMIGTVYREGSIVHITDPRNIWDGLSPDNKKMLMGDGVESGEVMKRGYIGLILATELTHEIVHLYQAPMLPETFFECGARWYTEAILKMQEYSSILSLGDQERIDFYQTLLDRYGDDVHHLFFNNSLGFERRTEILEEITPELSEQLFPAEIFSPKI
ncbi:MAG TPA: hypothetical protein VLF68_04395 [Candidatus Saccharimonadales bacterium]|nr:hypothetical protein [Candidatus Saccharimonadales bacterium]